MVWNKQNNKQSKKCERMSERETDIHILTDSQPKRRKIWQHAGWKIRQLVVVKIKVAERRSERELGLTLVGIAAQGCVWMCQCECVCACSISTVHLCVCLCACLIPGTCVRIHELLCMRNRHLTSSNTGTITLTLTKQNATQYHINISIYKQMYYTYHTFVGGN